MKETLSCCSPGNRYDGDGPEIRCNINFAPVENVANRAFEYVAIKWQRAKITVVPLVKVFIVGSSPVGVLELENWGKFWRFTHVK